jgi:DNA-binding CsgD family transcriptional regulator
MTSLGAEWHLSGPLRGRDAELEMLAGRTALLAEGQGGVVLISGAPGMGKSSLLSEGERLARLRGSRVCHGVGETGSQVVPLGPLLEALVSPADAPVDGNVLRRLTGLPDQRFWVLRELEEQLERAALIGPLTIGLDDIQWADPATLKAISALSRRLAYHPILWLLALRTGESAPEIRIAVRRLEAAGAHTLALAPLGSGAVEEVGLDLLGGRPDAGLRQIIQRAGGHPFLLVELLDGLREEGLVTVDGGQASLSSTQIPRRLLDSIGDQLGRLSAGTRYLLQLAAVLGRRFSVEELAEVMERPAAGLLPLLEEAIDVGLIIEDGDQLSFRHDLVRESVETRLPVSVKRSLGRRAAQVKLRHGAAPGDVASLILEVARPGDTQAVDLLRQAAAEVGRTSPSVAAVLSTRALELSGPDNPEFGELVVESIDLLVTANQATDAIRLIGEIAAGGQLEPLAEARARLSIVPLMMQYGAVEAVTQSRRALSLPGIPDELRIQMHSFMSASLDILGETAPLLQAAQAAVAEARATGEPAKILVTLLPQALEMFVGGDWQTALDLIGRAAEGQHSATGHALHLWLFDAWQAVLLLAVGRIDAALPLVESGSRQAVREGVAANLRIWSMVRCRLLLAQGNLADARAEAEAVLQLSDEFGEGARGYVNRIAMYVLASVAVHTGDPTGLDAGREIALDLLKWRECQASTAMGAWILARVTAPGQALDPAALDPLARGSLHASDPRRHADSTLLVRMLLDAEQRDEAVEVADRLERERTQSPDFPQLEAAATHARALVEHNYELAENAVELSHDDLRPLVRASVLEDAGRLAPSDRRRKAIAHLDAALALYAEAGAERDAARVRRLLRERGERRGGPGSRSVSPWPELTRSELAVVDLVSRGATNREVADQLYLSPHTVNAHLRHVYGKLGIRSRVELARIAASVRSAAS